MSDKSGKICQFDSLRIVANRIFIKDIISTLESCSSDVVGDWYNFGCRCVIANQTRLNSDQKVVFCELFCECCLRKIVWNRNLAADAHFVLADQCKVKSLGDGEVSRGQVMGCEGRQICDRDSLRILADWRLIEGVFGRSKSRCSYVDRNHCKPLSCRICFDNATSDLNREKILRKDGLKCGLCMVNRYFDFRT